MAVHVRGNNSSAGLVDYKDASSDSENEEEYILKPKRARIQKPGKGKFLNNAHSCLDTNY